MNCDCDSSICPDDRCGNVQLQCGISRTVSTVVGTTYASDDEDIYAVEAAYSKLEAELNQQINSMEARHEGYEEYRYQVDEISHNPYHLISYFTAYMGTLLMNRWQEK